MTVSINSPFKDLPDNKTLQELIAGFAPNVLNTSDLQAALDALTATDSFVNSLINNASFQSYLSTLLSGISSPITSPVALATLLDSPDFAAFLLKFLLANGFVDLATTVTALEADSGFLDFLTKLINRLTPPESALDFDAIASNLFSDTNFLNDLLAYITANPQSILTTALFLDGDVKGAISENRIDKLFGIPIDDSPFRSVVQGFEEDFNALVQVGSAPVVVNGKYEIYGINSHITISQFTESNGDKSLKIHYDGGGTSDVPIFIRSVSNFDGLGKRMDMFFNNNGLAGASQFFFGMIGDEWRTSSMQTASTNQRAFYENVAQNTYPQLAGAVSDRNHGSYNGMAAQASGKGTDFLIMRLQTQRGKAEWLTGGEHGGWSLEKGVTPPSASVYTTYIIACDVIFDHTAGVQDFIIKYISTNIGTGFPGSDLTMKFIAADNQFEFV